MEQYRESYFFFTKLPLINIEICQNAIYERDMPNDKSVPGLTEILWQHRSDGWEVGNYYLQHRFCQW